MNAWLYADVRIRERVGVDTKGNHHQDLNTRVCALPGMYCCTATAVQLLLYTLLLSYVQMHLVEGT